MQTKVPDTHTVLCIQMNAIKNYLTFEISTLDFGQQRCGVTSLTDANWEKSGPAVVLLADSHRGAD